jgi:NitT/TauT family transport system substrate-binding protein
MSTNNGKYRVILSGCDATVFPPTNSTIGMVSAKYAAAHPDVIKAIIKGRQMGVEYMRANRKEAAEIIAKEYKVDVATLAKGLDRMLDEGTNAGVPVFGDGRIQMPALQMYIEQSLLVGVVKEGVDIGRYIDESFLPAELKRQK